MRSLLSERDVQVIWLAGVFRRRGLRTEDGRAMEVVFPGFPAGEGGPDFRAARVVLDGVPREGDVEVHLTPSGWRQHGHERDAAYAGVILHVALRRDPFDRGTRGFHGAVPELILEPYLELPPAELLSRLARLVRGGASEGVSLVALGGERVAARAAALERLASASGPDGALYRALMTGLGYRNNKPGFAELARLVPWMRVHALRFGDARALYAAHEGAIAWRRCGRPANRPALRLDGWSRFVESLGSAGLVDTFAADPASAERRLAPVGPERARDLAINAVLPAMIAFGPAAARDAARELLRAGEPGPGNRRAREAAAALGIAMPASTLERLGLVEWRSRQ